RGDRQERRVPPDARRAGLDLLAGDGPVRVVDGLERPEAARADPDGIEGHLRLADATAKCGGGHYSFSFRPWLGIRPGLAPRSVGAGCRGVTGPVPSASLDAEPDSVARLQVALYKIKLTSARLLRMPIRRASRTGRGRPSCSGAPAA